MVCTSYKQIVDNEKKIMVNAFKLETIHAHIPRYIIALKFVDTKVQIQVSEEYGWTRMVHVYGVIPFVNSSNVSIEHRYV